MILRAFSRISARSSGEKSPQLDIYASISLIVAPFLTLLRISSTHNLS
nr:MAG TPA: hypothetical protein [Bacteriophage sp.]